MDKKGNPNRINDMITALLFASLMAFLLVGFIIFPKSEFSESENRMLAQRPEFSLESLINGEFTEKMSDYCADHFPMRNELLYLKAEAELAMLKGENNGVIKGSNGYLIKNADRADPDIIKENLAYLNQFYDKLSCPVYYAFAPRSVDILKNYIPSDYPIEKSEQLWQNVGKIIKEDDNRYIDLYGELSEHDDEQIYYKTDHHWTALGAYYAYAKIVTDMGEMPYSYSDFEVERASDSFYGTTWSFGCIPFIEPDSIDFLRFYADEKFEVTVGGKKTQTGLYDREYLTVKDKYSSYITSTVNGYIKIEAKEKEKDRKTIVLIKDSFAHAVAPMLARHFDLIMIDTRYYSPKIGEITSMAESGEINAVVALFGVNGLNDESYNLYKLMNA